VTALCAGAVVLWASDRVTWQGERTIFTADCLDGAWVNGACTGALAAGPRYRFRALRSQREVVFWIVGAVEEPSGRYTGCEIEDGRNWRCAPGADLARTITRQMNHGVAVPDDSGVARRFHPVSKWRWTLLSWGFPAGSRAAD
jgi:hypothetical protein